MPDPASRFNPEGPHGSSEVIDPEAFFWDEAWAGRPWSDVVLYEMHVGTFTPEGTYAAAEARLEALAATGVTAVELMPLSSFPGRFGWGYDGVLPYAPDFGYGTPHALKHFISAAHRLGLMVFLDVVYNHFGPDGNYLNACATPFFSKVHESPWGDALNFDGPGARQVREFFLQNALYWLHEYQFDGLRLDAVHAIKDDSTPDVIEELGTLVRAHLSHRHVHLVLENQNNESRHLPPEGQYSGQWNDDFHHALYVVATGDGTGYYLDYAQRPVELLARCLTHGFIWDGAERDPETGARKSLVAAAPQHLDAMVNFLDNHDQSGNRPFGERFSALVPAEVVPVATALALLGPATPMLFAGQEFASSAPFLYFADWDGELRDQVLEGRAREFAQFMRHDGEASARGEPPQACSVSTFEACKLDWDEAAAPAGQAARKEVAGLLALRAHWFGKRLGDLVPGAHVVHMRGERGFVLRWRFASGEVIQLEANLGADALLPDVWPSPSWPALSGTWEIHVVNGLADAVWPAWSARWSAGREARATVPDAP